LTKLSCLLLLLAADSIAAPVEKTSLNGSWRFSAEPPKAVVEQLRWHQAVFDDSGWSVTSLPQTAVIPGAVWYRRRFDVSGAASEKHVRIAFDGTLERTKVWLNGELIGELNGGPAPFELDLTPSVKAGATNTLCVRAENPGILRDVYLLTTGRVFPVRQAIVATPQRISVSVTVRNTLDNTSGVQAKFEVLSAGRVIGSASASGTVPPNSIGSMDGSIALRPEDVKLWDPDHPKLYQLHTVVAKSSEGVEGAYETDIASTFGIRVIEIHGTQLLLNGEPIRLGGANPIAEPNDQYLRMMKQAGMVFLKLSHPVSVGVLDWADQNGLLVIEGAHMRERDTNHPSVIAWSLAAENDYTHLKQIDPLRLTTAASSEPGAQADFLCTDAASLEATHSRWPDKPVLVGDIREPKGAAEMLRNHPYVIGAVPQTVEYPRWAEEFRAASISAVYQKNGNTLVEVHNRSGFPIETLRDYEVKVGPHTKRLPIMRPGESVTLEFEHVNPYTVEVRQPTGFVVDSR
jgi:beta-glucuronidase